MRVEVLLTWCLIAVRSALVAWGVFILVDVSTDPRPLWLAAPILVVMALYTGIMLRGLDRVLSRYEEMTAPLFRHGRRTCRCHVCRPTARAASDREIWHEQEFASDEEVREAARRSAAQWAGLLERLAKPAGGKS